MNPLKIIHSCPPITISENGIGGLETFVYTLDKELILKGHKSQVIAGEETELFNDINKKRLLNLAPTEVLKGEKTNMTPFEGQRARYMFQLASELNLINSLDSDIIHSHASFSPVLGNYVNKPIIATIHAPIEWLWDAENLGQFNKGNSHLVCISETQKKIYEAQGFDIAKVIYNGIEVDKFPFLKNKKNYVFTIARIEPAKAQHLAIESAKKIGMDIIIAGNKIDKQYFNSKIQPEITHDLSESKNKIREYRQLIAQELGDSKVIYFGPANFVEKGELYSNAKATIMTTKLEESFGLVTAESLACGTPVVGLDTGATKEILREGKEGFITKNPEEISELIKKAEKINPYNCRKRIEEAFSVEKMTSEYIKFYNEIINK